MNNLLERWYNDAEISDEMLQQEVRELSGLDEAVKNQLPEELHKICDSFFDVVWMAAEDEATSRLPGMLDGVLTSPEFKKDVRSIENADFSDLGLPEYWKEALISMLVFDVEGFKKVTETYMKLSGIEDPAEILNAWGFFLEKNTLQG